jgi:hypothetical protein
MRERYNIAYSKKIPEGSELEQKSQRLKNFSRESQLVTAFITGYHKARQGMFGKGDKVITVKWLNDTSLRMSRDRNEVVFVKVELNKNEMLVDISNIMEDISNLNKSIYLEIMEVLVDFGYDKLPQEIDNLVSTNKLASNKIKELEAQSNDLAYDVLLSKESITLKDKEIEDLVDSKTKLKSKLFKWNIAASILVVFVFVGTMNLDFSVCTEQLLKLV